MLSLTFDNLYAIVLIMSKYLINNLLRYLIPIALAALGLLLVTTKASAYPAIFTGTAISAHKLVIKGANGKAIHVRPYDHNYEVVSLASLQQFTLEAKSKKSNIRYVDQRYDCDDFTRMFNAELIRSAYHPANTAMASVKRYAPAVGQIEMYWKERSADGRMLQKGHMASIILTDQGWYVVDITQGIGPIPIEHYHLKDKIKLAVF